MLSAGRCRYAVTANVVTRIIDPHGEASGDSGPAVAGAPGSRRAIDLYSIAGETAPDSVVLLHLDGAGRSVVVAVDQVDDIREVSATEIAPIPAFVFEGTSRLIRGVLRDAGGLRLLLDEGSLV